jgi:ABC-2 type transport system permease protein
MELRLLVRSPESLLVTFGIPLGLLVFFSTVDVLPTGERGGVEFLVPGVLAISVAATGLVAVSIQTAFERKYGVLKRLGGTPLPRTGFLAAKGLAVGCLLLLQTAATLAIAAGPLGWRPAGGLAIAALVVLVGRVTHTALGLLLAGTLRAEATLALSNALFLVLLVVSGVSFDAGAPGVARRGRAGPAASAPSARRSGARSTAGSPWGPLALVAGWGASAIGVAARTFRWEP